MVRPGAKAGAPVQEDAGASLFAQGMRCGWGALPPWMVGGACSPWPPLTALPRLAAAGRRGGEHFPGVIRGGAVKPPEPALPHCLIDGPMSPAAGGQGWGETHGAALALSSSLLCSLLTLRQRQHWKMAQPGWPPQPPARGGHPPQFPSLPSAGLWGSPTGKRGAWQRAGAGTPCLCCPPSAVISPIQSGRWALPRGPCREEMRGSAKARPPHGSDLSPGLLLPQANLPLRPSPRVPSGASSGQPLPHRFCYKQSWFLVLVLGLFSFHSQLPLDI